MLPASVGRRPTARRSHRGPYLSCTSYFAGRARTGRTERGPAEVSLRLSRGFLASAAEGMSSSDAAADFERCAQLSGSDLEENQSIATFVALFGYYALRADLRRVQQLLGYLDELRTHLSQEQREWFQPFSDAAYGMLAWYRGDSPRRSHQLEAAPLSRSEEGARETAAVWYMPTRPPHHLHPLVAGRYMSALGRRRCRSWRRPRSGCGGTGFPQDASSQAYGRQMEVLIRIEPASWNAPRRSRSPLGAGSRANGPYSWTMIGAAQRATVDAMSALAEGAVNPTTVRRTSRL